ncbi:hypothetical protein EOL99_04495 [Candidatus Falkowbacteria bacterium]|nr:hypothetical protein [Candidatus Falkowbacteria bacterium]
MANHTIEIINRAQQKGQSNNLSENQKKTSVKNQIVNKQQNSRTSQVNSGTRPSTIKRVGGALLALAGAKQVVKSTRKVNAIYADFMGAKTGETMRSENMKAGAQLVTQGFITTAKQFFWDYGVVEAMRINRQNEQLNYDRELTGNIILSKTYNKGVF